jgi:hypothetical protein
MKGNPRIHPEVHQQVVVRQMQQQQQQLQMQQLQLLQQHPQPQPQLQHQQLRQHHQLRHLHRQQLQRQQLQQQQLEQQQLETRQFEQKHHPLFLNEMPSHLNLDTSSASWFAESNTKFGGPADCSAESHEHPTPRHGSLQPDAHHNIDIQAREVAAVIATAGRGFTERLQLLLEAIKERDSDEVFHHPVDTKLWGDYLDVVMEPMDFSKMGAKIAQTAYQTTTDFATDLAIIWNNCRTYNESASAICQIATRMESWSQSLLHEVNDAVKQRRSEPAGPCQPASTHTASLQSIVDTHTPVKPKRQRKHAPTQHQGTPEQAQQYAARGLVVGAVVDADFRGHGQWYAGTISAANPDGTFHVSYADGDIEPAVDPRHIRPKCRAVTPNAPPGLHVGTIAWAKIEGFPDWPGQLAEISTRTQKVESMQRGPGAHLVIFYGSAEYAFVDAKDIRIIGAVNDGDQLVDLEQAAEMAKQACDAHPGEGAEELVSAYRSALRQAKAAIMLKQILRD